MKPLPTPGRFLLPPLLAFVLAACHERKEVAKVQVAETNATEHSPSSESAERRRVRVMLEGVVIPQIDFGQTSAEEGADHVEFRIKEIAPAKAVKIVVRRPMPLDEDGRPIVGGNSATRATRGKRRTSRHGRPWSASPVTTG